MSQEMKDEKRALSTDLSTVESQRNDLAFEEFPDGPYGSPVNAEQLGKSTPWRVDQRSSGRFDYENHELHEGHIRDFPGQDVFDERIPDDVNKPRVPEE